ncbi:hypothetical protein KQX54_004365 [Cotesia glomerata]|uniref:Uncharacterized protein n=1 Tax=Cotesia glomerata TaxID=32391 RepID=A0AAV7J217_COTGL|nr:hypothetical protein KQX54_004365 [Cotesia glomerata]
MPADAELSNILSRRQRINEDLEEGKEVKKQYKFVNVYTEFHELSRREIKQYEQTFNRKHLAKNLVLCSQIPKNIPDRQKSCGSLLSASNESFTSED